MNISTIIIDIIGIIIFFLVIREIVTWYWKINKIETTLKRIEKNTRKEGVVYPDDEDDDEYLSF